ncbi:hypothetical protein GCM10009828_006240 [Actinoplanes couchii]|uniref:Uncharacterized protein n=1 Tax=Actinoplanes couchii TaxID=403638 RepID=A0ABQ3XJY0_9ACTN|nr:hypothetical protein Aco03nite_072000 [Actinoplanes couchii]
MRADLERQDLESHIRQPCGLDQMSKLVTHDRVTADGATHHRFIEYHPKIDWIVLNQQRLALHADADPMRDSQVGVIPSGGSNESQGVFLALQQTGNHLLFVRLN